MERELVISSNIESIWYDKQNNILEIKFNSWWIYQYLWVPENIYQDLLNASSIDSYFSTEIRNNYKSLNIK